MSAACQAGHTTVTLSQSRYLVDGSTDQSSASTVWNMPVCLHTDSDRTTCELLERPRTTVTLDGCPAWTMPNAGGRGYYRASLDSAALKALEGNIPKLSGPERLTLLADEWALVRARLHDVGSYLDLASAYGSEETEQVLESLTEALRAIDQQLTTPASRPAFRAWVRRLLGPSAAKRRMGREEREVRRQRARAFARCCCVNLVTLRIPRPLQRHADWSTRSWPGRSQPTRRCSASPWRSQQ